MKNMVKMFALMKDKGTNQLDDLTLGLVNAMKYSNSDVEYPDFEGISPKDGVKPEWFYAVYRGTNGFSEMNAILQYVSQDTMYEEIGEMMLGIAMVEMKHLDKIGDFIKSLGGDIAVPYDTSHVAYGHSAEDAVRLGIEAEMATIDEYNRIAELVKAVPENKTTKTTLQLLAKLIADEQWHIDTFRRWQENR
jgi:bacterioferritin (cytochrome b1)